MAATGPTCQFPPHRWLGYEDPKPTSEELALRLCTFKPNISASPRASTERRVKRERTVLTSEQRALELCTFQPKVNCAPSMPSRPSSARPRSPVKTSEERALAFCTFVPRTNFPATGMPAASGRARSPPKARGAPNLQSSSRVRPPVKTSEERALESCTFVPKTNYPRPSSAHAASAPSARSRALRPPLARQLSAERARNKIKALAAPGRAWAPHALQIDAVAAALPADEVHTLARALGGGISSKAMAALNAAHAAAMANSCAI